MERTLLSLTDTIKTLVDEKKYATLKDILETMNPVDIAELFEQINDEKIPILFRLLPKELAADTFVEMDEETQELLIHGFSDSELKDVVDELFVDDAVDIIEEMPAIVVKRILRQADPVTRKAINELLRYPDDSAGSMMTTEFISLRPAMTVEEAIKRIRRTGVDKETIYTCYVTDNLNKLIGIMTVKTLLLSEETQRVEDLMEDNVISVHTLDDQEEVANLFTKYGLLAMPVVDTENRLVGIVTIDDAMDVLEEEVTEDFEKMAAVMPSDKPYMKTSVFGLFKKRIVWLAVLMLSATFTSTIIKSFESALAANIALSAFIPMLMNTGGNAGSQASVSIIRAISLDEVKFKDVFRIMWKEFRVAIICGIVLSAANFLKILLLDFHGTPYSEAFPIALVVSVTMLSTVVIAKLIGCLLPLLADKIGFDPAVMASPMITTIVDAVSLLVYFQSATIILSGV